MCGWCKIKDLRGFGGRVPFIPSYPSYPQVQGVRQTLKKTTLHVLVERRTEGRDDRGSTADHSHRSSRSSLVATVICAIATDLQQLSCSNCHLRHCLSLPTALKFVCPSVEKYSHNPIYKPTACYLASLPKLTRTMSRNPQKLLYTSVLTSKRQHRSPGAPLLHYPNTETYKKQALLEEDGLPRLKANINQPTVST
jgi:hypothetical protein